MPAKGRKVGSIQTIIRMNEGIDKILGSFSYMTLHHLRRIHSNLLLLPKGIIWLRIIDYLQSVIIDLNPIGKGPHLIKLILVLVDHNLSVDVVLKDSDLKLVILDLVHG